MEQKIEENFLLAIDRTIAAFYGVFCVLNKKEPTVSEELNFKMKVLEELRQIYVNQAINILNELEKQKEQEVKKDEQPPGKQ